MSLRGQGAQQGWGRIGSYSLEGGQKKSMHGKEMRTQVMFTLREGKGGAKALRHLGGPLRGQCGWSSTEIMRSER
jgi:hypothetical protein